MNNFVIRIAYRAEWGFSLLLCATSIFALFAVIIAYAFSGSPLVSQTNILMAAVIGIPVLAACILFHFKDVLRTTSPKEEHISDARKKDCIIATIGATRIISMIAGTCYILFQATQEVYIIWV